jgi:hypothetical protein
MIFDGGVVWAFFAGLCLGIGLVTILILINN